MISWVTIVWGALLSALAAAVVVFVLGRERRFELLGAVAASAAVGPLLWNAILHRVGASEFFVDAPLGLMPASWQDTGSGVFALAVGSLVLGFGPARSEVARRVALLSLLGGLAAFLVDVYLY